MNDLDGGSDLSELSDLDSDGVSLTPGVASTPRTTPTPGKHGRPIKESPRSPLATAFPDGKGSKQEKNGKLNDQESDTTSRRNDGGKKSKGKGKRSKAGKKAEKDSRRDYSDEEVADLKAMETLDAVSAQDVPSTASKDQELGVKKPTKKTNMRGWAYVLEPEETPLEQPIIEGKRARRPTLQYVNSSKPAKGGRTASASELPPFEPDREMESPVTSAAYVEASGSRPVTKIVIQVNRKKQPKTSTDDTGDADRTMNGDADTKDLTVSPPEEDEDEDQPSLKRKRAKAPLTFVEDDEEGDYVEKDESSVKSKSKARRSEQPSGVKKKKKKRRREEESAVKLKGKDESFAADDGSDDYRQGKVSDDDAMSEDDDDDDDEAPPVRSSKAAPMKEPKMTMPPLKRKSDSLLANETKVAPRNSTGSIPHKDTKTVAGLISAYKKPASSLQSTPVKSIPPKAAIRKVPSMNLFDNLMGFGSTSKEGTPGKSPAVRPRPSGSGVNTPQGTSPMVRPPGPIKREDEMTAAGTATPTRMHSTLAKASPLASNGKSKPGADGEHVTAAEMAIRKKQELYSNANPMGIFDLLQGAEIMMQFEEETRQLLPSDPVISKYKLYKASRTEGLSKLVDRIKETNRSQSHTEIIPETQPSEIAT